MVAQALNVACIFNALTGGTGDFTVLSPTAGHVTPEQASVVDGKVYEYFAITPDGLTWESGEGAYTVATHKLARTTISCTSNDDPVKISFMVAPIVCVIPSPSSTLEQGQVPAGSRTVWQQSTAPIGWTKDISHNDKALRIVSGAAGSGGTNSFSSVMAQTTVGSTTPTTGTMANHAHTDYYQDNNGSGGPFAGAGPCDSPAGAERGLNTVTGTNGGGSSHNHTLLMSMLYVDVILATKN